MPGWHEATKALQQAGTVQLVGIIQEQHPDRCRLFVQWKQMGWPILVDSFNETGSKVVPNVWAVDEHGVVRQKLRRPDVDTLQREFLSVTFDAPKTKGEEAKPGSLPEAVQAFRRGVTLRRRDESEERRPGDFASAIAEWKRALALDPDHYIWRRRIQQYGPLLDKPYAFYDWVDTARAEIKARGEVPHPLRVEPRGSELAGKEVAQAPAPPAHPDPTGKVTRDDKLIEVEVVLVPHTSGGRAHRVHLLFRPASGTHWNNEAEPLRVWLDLPQGWQADRRFVEVSAPKAATSGEPRRVEFDLRPSPGGGALTLSAFYNVCTDADGACLFRRRDLELRID